MAIQSGTHLGPYEILSAIGAGGMGEVYRARDPKLGRDVAIKVLPEAFARDAERMARFQREAKVLASLDHPNIASIYGLEDSGGTHALVMQLVEGPTLADRIKAGPSRWPRCLPARAAEAENKNPVRCCLRAPESVFPTAPFRCPASPGFAGEYGNRILKRHRTERVE